MQFLSRVVCTILFFSFTYQVNAQFIMTVAGNGSNNTTGDGGQAVTAEIGSPTSIVLDTSGNMYLSIQGHPAVRKINSAGIISTLVDFHPATAGPLTCPQDITIDKQGNLYVADKCCDCIHKIDVSGNATIFAGGGPLTGDNVAATNTALFEPTGVAVDNAGNVYICDQASLRVRKVDPAGNITTVAGTGQVGNSGDNGPATLAKISPPQYVAVDNNGNIYFTTGALVRKVNGSGIISTIITGSGYSMGIAADSRGNVYVSDISMDKIWKVDSNGSFFAIAGTGTAGYNGDYIMATNAQLNQPYGLTVDKKGNIYFADQSNNRIRVIRYDLETNTTPKPLSAGLSVWPNPAYTGQFTLDIYSAENEEAQVIITNALGQCTKEIFVPTNKETNISLEAVPGVYFLKAVSTHFSITEQIIVTGPH